MTGRQNKQDTKDLELKVNNQQVRDPVILAHELNTFFARSIEEISELFTPSESPVRLESDEHPNFIIQEISAVEVINIISALNNSKAKDIYSLDTSFLKTQKEAVALPITHLVNLSIKHSIVQKAWKLATVTPIFKSGDRSDMNNY